MEGRARGLRPAQDVLQPLRPLEPDGGFRQNFAGMADEGPKPERIIIGATHLKAPRRCEPA